MKYLGTVIFLGAVGCVTSSAWAQYGLYGSPTMLRLPQVQPATASSYGYPTDYPSTTQPTRAVGPTSYGSASFGRAVAPVAYSPTPPGAASPGQVPGGAGPPAMSAPVNAIPAAPSPLGTPPAAPLLQPAPAEGQGVISQMLQDSGCYAPTQPPPDPGYPSTFGQAACAPGTEGCAVPAVPCFQSNWYASARGLMMTRNQANRLWTTYESGDNPNQIPTDRSWEWSGGGEIRFGRWFCCGTYAIEAAYWTLDPFSSFVSRSIVDGSVSTPLMVNDIEFDGINGTQYFDSAREHRVWRRSEVQSIEINFVGSGAFQDQCLFDVDWVAGAHFFRFQDDFRFGSLDLGGTWHGRGGLDEAYLRDKIRNDLVGFHFGCNANRQLGYNLKVFLNPSIGIYNNHIQNLFELYRGDGTVANPTPASGMTGTYPVESSKDVLAFMTQIDVGLNWQFGLRNWDAYIGYRVLFATGIGLADAQVPTYVVDIPEIADINYNGDLILHGAFAGLTLRF